MNFQNRASSSCRLVQAGPWDIPSSIRGSVVLRSDILYCRDSYRLRLSQVAGACSYLLHIDMASYENQRIPPTYPTTFRYGIQIGATSGIQLPLQLIVAKKYPQPRNQSFRSKFPREKKFPSARSSISLLDVSKILSL